MNPPGDTRLPATIETAAEVVKLASQPSHVRWFGSALILAVLLGFVYLLLANVFPVHADQTRAVEAYTLVRQEMDRLRADFRLYETRADKDREEIRKDLAETRGRIDRVLEIVSKPR